MKVSRYKSIDKYIIPLIMCFFMCIGCFSNNPSTPTGTHTSDSENVVGKRRRRESPQPTTSSAATQVVETMREAVAAIRERKEDDRDTVFAKFILSELKALPQNEANILRLRLHRVVLEFTEDRQSRQIMPNPPLNEQSTLVPNTEQPTSVDQVPQYIVLENGTLAQINV